MPPIIRKCVVFGCVTQASRGFHKFPKNSVLQKTWLNKCGLTSLKDHDKICSKHFKSDDFFPRRSENQYLHLKQGVVPSRNLPEVCVFLQQEKKIFRKIS